MEKESFLDILLQLPIDIKDEYKTYPKFIRRFFIKRHIKNISKSIKRIIDKKIVLDKNILDQYINILYNNHDNTSIFYDIDIKEMGYHEANGYKLLCARFNIEDNNISGVIKSRDTEDTFELEILYQDKDFNNRHYTFINDKFICIIDDYQPYISKVNEAILNDICEFFEDYIKRTLEDDYD